MNFNSKIIDGMDSYVYGEQPQIEDIIKINTNENPYPPTPLINKFMKEFNIATLAKYCDPSCFKLKNIIASTFKIDSSNVFIGNGSDDVLFHIYKAFLDRSDKVIFPDISYGFYEVYANLFEIDAVKIPLRDDFSINLDDYIIDGKVVLIANPNAPTSLAISKDIIDTFILNNPNKLIVIDEAYADFSNESCIDMVLKYPNLIVVQTLSKSSSLAGLRLGYCLGNSELIKTMEKTKNSLNPYNVDTIAQSIGYLSFKDHAYKKEIINKVVKTRSYFSTELIKLGFNVLESQTNFIFCEHHLINAEALYNKLLKKKIYVRYFNKARLSNYLRITIGSQMDMEKVVFAINEIILEENK